MIKLNPKFNEKRCGERMVFKKEEKKNSKLTSERPTIDPCILGSAIGDLFPGNQKFCQSTFLIKRTLYYHENQDKRVNP